MKRVQQPIRNEDLAGLSSLIFGSLTFLAGTFSLWSLTASLRVTKNFAVSSGLFSNWLVWVAVAAAIHYLGRRVERELQRSRSSAPVVVFERAQRRVRPTGPTSAAA